MACKCWLVCTTVGQWDEVRKHVRSTHMATSTRTLLIAFLAVVAAFIGSTIWAQRVGRGIDRDALEISRDAAPGIEAISRLRAEMRNLEVEVGRAVETQNAISVAETRARMDGLIAEVLSLPSDAREATLLGTLQSAIRAFDEAVERAMEQARAGEPWVARRTLADEARPAGDRAAAAAQELVDYDAQLAREAALRIESERARSNRLAFQLDALCAALALVAAWLAWRAFQQTHRIQEEHQRLVERKAEELEQFAGRVAHDILSPLATVSLSLTVAERTAPLAREALVRGASSLARVRGIVDGLLGFARAGARPEPGARAEVAPLVAGLAEELLPFAAQHHALLEIEQVPACTVCCSEGVLLSLLSNLLRNAIKYLGAAQIREVSLRVRLRRGKVLFEVEDTGPGIPAELAGRIFEPYVRGPAEGVPGIGLGLATVKRLVESHGGSVGVRANPRGGSIFWFELEQAQAALPIQAEFSGNFREL